MSARNAPISELGQFFGGYLHQDWKMQYPDAWSAVTAYVAEAPLMSRMRARQELEVLLQTHTTEHELSGAVDRVHLNFYPPGAGTTYRAWLEKVEQYLREHES